MAKQPLWLNTRTLLSHLFFGPYIFVPLIGALTWLGGILALLGLWVSDGKPRYKSNEASVVFISDVGAVHHTLFICIGCVTGGCYVLALFTERWLRHVDRLPITMRTVTKVLDGLAIFFGVVGAAGLILLTVFDTFHHSTIHWTMTVVFVVGTAISAIFQLAEIWTLHQTHPDRRSLLRTAIVKMIIVVVAIAVAIGFGATYAVCRGRSYATRGHSAQTCNRVTSVAAALEWTVAFILTFFFLTLVADLWPSGKSSPRYMRRLARWQQTHGEGDDFTGRRAFQEHPERWQDRYQFMKQSMRERNNGQAKTNGDRTDDTPMVSTGLAGTGPTPVAGHISSEQQAVAYPPAAAAPITGKRPYLAEPLVSNTLATPAVQ